MNRDTIRSVGIFAAVAIVLLALVVGGLRLIKERNVQYARTQGQEQVSQPPQANNPPQQEQNQGQNQNQNQSQQNPTPQQQQPPQSQPANPSPAPAPQPQNQPVQQSQANPVPAQVPVTGPAEDALLTVALMMIAAYFGYMLKRAKLSYRRLLS